MRFFRPAVLGILAGCVACSSKGNEADKRPRTERERDSIIGASRLPGAQGVRGALRESDAAKARNAQLDSVANQP